MEMARARRGTRARDTEELAAALRRFKKAEGLTQATLAKRTGIDQPQISRALSGRLSHRSPAMRKLCELAGISLADSSDPSAGQRRILDVVGELWDGTDTDALRVEALLRAAAALRHRE